jgi:hypothetical protein
LGKSLRIWGRVYVDAKIRAGEEFMSLRKNIHPWTALYTVHCAFYYALLFSVLVQDSVTNVSNEEKQKDNPGLRIG